MKSACRGLARNAPAPKRSRSKRLAPTAIISIAQHARPNVIGHTLDSFAQFIACSNDEMMTFSSKRPSIQLLMILIRCVWGDCGFIALLVGVGVFHGTYRTDGTNGDGK